MRSEQLRAISRPCVITGIGVLSGAAVGVDAFWNWLIDTSPQDTATALVDFDPHDWLDRRVRRYTEPFAQYAMAAAQLAEKDAQLIIDDPERAAVVLGVGNVTSTTPTVQYLAYEKEGPSAVSPLLGVLSLPNAGAAGVALQLGITGTTTAISSGCASATHAIGEAARLVQLGFADVVITGGADSFWSPGTDDTTQAAAASVRAAYRNLKVSTADSVAHPFASDRSGFVPSDGAAVLVLESLERARARGAHVYAEVCGYGNTNDADNLVSTEESGAGVRRAMEQAIADAAARPSDVGYINAHGSATLASDRAEALAINGLFGSPGPPVSAFKGRIGHAGPAAGAVEAAGLALAIEHALIPATAGLDRPDPTLEIDIVHGTNRPWQPALALSTSAGLGGHNGCIALRPVATA